MAFNRNIHHRRSIRLPGYDYSQPNAYFVTICAYQKECLFGEISEDGEMRRNEYGCIIADEWIKTVGIRQEIELDEWIIMPNHMHGIVWIVEDVGACGARPPHGVNPTPRFDSRSPVGACGARPDRKVDPSGQSEGVRHTPVRGMAKSLGSFVGGFKAAVTKRIRILDPDCVTIWHRNYYERVIRSDHELEAIRRYILENPIKWALDPENPMNKPKKPCYGLDGIAVKDG